MITILATKENLSCLLNLNRQLEQFPEPFRLQPSVAVQITVDAYNDYLVSLGKDSNSTILLSGMQKNSNIENSSDSLYRAYLTDIAGAILKEVSFAEEYTDDATRILPIEPNPEQILSPDLVSRYVSLNLTQYELRARNVLYSAGFAIPKKVSAKNKPLFDLGIVLYYLAQRSQTCSGISCLCTDYM